MLTASKVALIADALSDAAAPPARPSPSASACLACLHVTMPPSSCNHTPSRGLELESLPVPACLPACLPACKLPEGALTPTPC
jgi:hypothetical protein